MNTPLLVRCIAKKNLEDIRKNRGVIVTFECEDTPKAAPRVGNISGPWVSEGGHATGSGEFSLTLTDPKDLGRFQVSKTYLFSLTEVSS